MIRVLKRLWFWSVKIEAPSPRAVLIEEIDRSRYVVLMFVKETPTGAILSSDYAECRVKRGYFQQIDGMTAVMPIEHARSAGLADGWT